MPVADYAVYCEMLDRAARGKFAYPGFNVTSMTTTSAVLRGLAESRSDGIIQVSTGGGQFASGSAGKDHSQSSDVFCAGPIDPLAPAPRIVNASGSTRSYASGWPRMTSGGTLAR